MASPSSEEIQTSPDEQEPQQNVLIVGAGPVGPATALRLAQAGIMVDIIETEQQLSEEPRAVTYYASALVALDKMGIIPDMKEAVFVSARFCWRKPIRYDGQGGYKIGDIICRGPVPRDRNAHGIRGILHLPQAELTKLLFEKAI
ncbi:hypothetical protein N7467_000617 [Penicillium canescens]|nr:hypothetical protein N7467_000617 [Penicillium canescens]